MNFKEYQKEIPKNFKPFQPLNEQQTRAINWTVGICNEAGELAGVVKHGIFHGEPLDRMVIAKEIGDVMWYLTALCETLGITLEDCAELNIAKLTHRHQGKQFTTDGSNERHQREEAFTDTKIYKQLKERITNA